MQTLLFVDTNLFLQYKAFDDLPWHELITGGDVCLCICGAVLRELDRHKFSERPRVQRRAKDVIRKLSGLVHAPNVDVPLKQPGVSVRVLLDSPGFSFPDYALDPQSADDRIVAAALQLREQHETLAIAASDLGLHLKATNHDVRSVRLPDDWLLPPEQDDTRRQLEAAQRKLLARENAAPVLKLTFEDGAIVLNRTVKLRQQLDEGSVQSKVDRLRSKFPQEPINPLPAHLAGQAAHLYTVGYPSRADWESFNKSLETFYADCAVDFRNLHRTMEPLDRIITLKLVLTNTGAAAGQDIDVVLKTEGLGRWLSERPPAPRHREPPSRPGHHLDAFLRQPDLSHILGSAIRQPNVVGPTIQSTDARVEFRVGVVKCGLPVNFPPVYFQFASFDQASSFTIRYELFARNTGEPKRDVLHVVVNDSPS